MTKIQIIFYLCWIMDFLTVFLLAVALCFDSFAVSVSCALSCCVWQRGRGVRFALILGAMQGLMVLIGWLVAWKFSHVISAWDHWIAFSLLFLLGAKMIVGAVRASKSDDEDNLPAKEDPFRLWPAVVLGFATSIDAVIAGVTMAFLTITLVAGTQLVNVLLSCAVVGVVTVAASLSGLLLGRRVKGKLGAKAELIGGVVLIMIGLKVLFEHL